MINTRLGRNDRCSCGSGKKYKKCCMNRSHSTLATSNIQKINETFSGNQGALVMTTTKEPHMPIRLYYRVHNKPALVSQLATLRCVELTDDDRFFITYSEEAKRLGLSVKYNKVPQALYPIILAHGHIINDIFHLDLRSFERGVRMVEFIDKHIDRTIANITHAATYNRINRVTEKTMESLITLDYDQLFSEKNMSIINPEAVLEELNAATLHAQNSDEKRRLATAHLEKLENQALPLIEKFPVNDGEEGIRQLNVSLKFKMMMAFEQLSGNVKCTPFQLIQRTLKKIMNR